MRLLVTGGAGFIGSNFVRFVLERHSEDEVVVLDKLTYAGNLANLAEVQADPRFSFVRGDICEPRVVRQAMAGCDVVVNFAAETHVDRAIGDAGSFVQTDVFGVYVLLEAARDLGVARFIQISTDEVYGERLDSPADETSALMPRNPYAAAKAGGDRLAWSYWATYGTPVVVTRCSNTYGPNQYPEKLIPLFVTNALESQPLPVYGSGENIRDWIHVLDHAEALDVILRADSSVHGQIYNICAENALTVLEITRHILDALGRSESLVRHVADRQGHDRKYWLTSRKIREQLGWRPRYTFDDGILATVRWYQENPGWWRPIKSGAFREYYRRQYSEIAGS